MGKKKGYRGINRHKNQSQTFKKDRQKILKEYSQRKKVKERREYRYKGTKTSEK